VDFAADQIWDTFVMTFSFRALAGMSATLCLLLSAVWMLAPEFVLALWRIDAPEPALIVARRGAALFLGLGVMLFLVRDARKSPERDAISAGMAIACATLAALGFYEWLLQRAGAGVWLAIVTELALVAAFVKARLAP